MFKLAVRFLSLLVVSGCIIAGINALIGGTVTAGDVIAACVGGLIGSMTQTGRSDDE